MCDILNSVTVADLEQLRSYLERRDVYGWYYGRKKVFERRHEKLLDLVDDMIDFVRRRDEI